MKILVAGARGFVGKNLCEALKCIRDGKDCRSRYQSLLPLTLFEYDKDSSEEELLSYCEQAEFVFNLAGVNRPKDESEFMEGNYGFASKLLNALEQCGNKCPVMLSSSIQASLEGRYAGSEYGRSKLAGEQLLRDYSARTGAPVLIYRFPNLYGKWCRPNYNSAIATFCNNIAGDLPIRVDDESAELELLYIDDVIAELLEALVGNETSSESGFCEAGPIDRVSLGAIVELLYSFKNARETLNVPDLSKGSFSKKLYSTYLSYLNPENFACDLKMNVDGRGSFTEVIRTPERGQISVNISKPGITKGQHWHHSKWEKFVVVSGQGLIRLRKIGQDSSGKSYPVVEYRVSGEKLIVVEMIPGYTHSITNLSETDDLVTVMWANEAFNPDEPDTFYEQV